LRVSILHFPHCGGAKRLAETNHEQTLYVRYVFRNHLIWRERVKEIPRACVPQRYIRRAGAAQNWCPLAD
jgi:hypothetical protein